MFEILKGPISKREKVCGVVILIAGILSAIAVYYSFLLFKDLTKNAHQSINMAAQSVKQTKRVKEDSESTINMYKKYLNLCEDDFERTQKKLDVCDTRSEKLEKEISSLNKALENCHAACGK